MPVSMIIALSIAILCVLVGAWLLGDGLGSINSRNNKDDN
jgi:hypothetical protein